MLAKVQWCTQTYQLPLTELCDNYCHIVMQISLYFFSTFIFHVGHFYFIISLSYSKLWHCHIAFML